MARKPKNTKDTNNVAPNGEERTVPVEKVQELAEQAAQEQAQQAQQDPLVQMQQQELQIKQKEAEIKEKKLIVDATAKSEQLDIERERIAAQERIAGLQVGARLATDEAALSAKQQAEGLRMGVEIAREAAQASKPTTKGNE